MPRGASGSRRTSRRARRREPHRRAPRTPTFRRGCVSSREPPASLCYRILPAGHTTCMSWRHHRARGLAGSHSRDHLRDRPDSALEYGQLKRRLAEADDQDRPRYRAAEAPFIAEILRKATAGPCRRAAGKPAAAWTSGGASHEYRGLKQRPEHAVRPVPIPARVGHPAAPPPGPPRNSARRAPVPRKPRRTALRERLRRDLAAGPQPRLEPATRGSSGCKRGVMPMAERSAKLVR